MRFLIIKKIVYLWSLTTANCFSWKRGQICLKRHRRQLKESCLVSKSVPNGLMVVGCCHEGINIQIMHVDEMPAVRHHMTDCTNSIFVLYIYSCLQHQPHCNINNHHFLLFFLICSFFLVECVCVCLYRNWDSSFGSNLWLPKQTLIYCLLPKSLVAIYICCLCSQYLSIYAFEWQSTEIL